MRQWLLNVWRMCLGLVEVPAKVRRSRERAQLRFEQLEDRTVPATFLVRDILGGSSGSGPTEFVNVNGTLFFVADDGTGTNGHGKELWKSDGTSTGTVLVADIRPGPASSGPRYLTNVNGTLFFVADDGTGTNGHGKELWKSDGTSTGTVLVKDIYSGAYSSNPDWLTNVNGTLFFRATEAFFLTGTELWKSDGTSTGTVLVKDIQPFPYGSYPSQLTNVNGTLFFQANDGTKGYELWKSDGTSTGTVLVADIRPGPASSGPRYLTNVNGTLFFVANDGTNGIELWKSDGTSTGTVLVADIRPGAYSSNPDWLTNVNGTLFFAANDGTNGIELWKSDGTSSGTVLVKDIRTDISYYGSYGSDPIRLSNVNGTLFFAANDGTNGTELWKSDGTSSGTVLVKDIDPSAFGSYPGYLTNVNGTLFFVANDGTSGTELWKSDGTSTGTVLVADIRPGSPGSLFSYPSLTNVNGTLFFGADDGTNGVELWATDEWPPTITSVTGPAPGTYIVGQNLDFTVVFSEAVAVTGTPRLVLTIGSTTRYATYLSGSGTSTLVFRYTVQSGDLDSDGIAVASPIDLNGGTIKDTNGNDAVLTFTPPNTSGVLVDGVAPTITSVSGPAAGTYIVGQNLDFTVQFDDTVVVDTTGGTPRLELTIGSATQYATYLSGSGTSTLVFRYTVQVGDLDSDGIAVASPIDLNGGTIKDTNGNDAVLTFTPPNTSGVLVDGVAPTITSVTGPAAATYIVGQHLDFTVQFSEAVAVTGTPRLVLTIGSTTRYATYVSGSGSASLLFRYTVQAGDEDTDGIAVASPIDLNGGTIKDVPGNDAGLSFTPPDTSGVLVVRVPAITSVTGPAAATYIVGQDLDFTVQFDETVVVDTTGGTPRLQLTIGSTTRFAMYVSGSGSANLVFRYTVQSDDLDSDGIAVASPIDLNGGTIKDTNGNDAVLSFTPPDTSSVLVDGVAPAITSVTGPAAGTYIVGQHLDFTVLFSDVVAVTGTPRLVLTIGSTTRFATYVSGSGSASLLFRYTVQSGDLDSDGIAVASPIDLNGGTIRDLPGNNAVLTFTPPVTSGVLVDGVAPAITSVSGPAAGTYIVGQHLDFTVLFSDVVAVTGTPRLQLTIGSTTGFATYVSGSGSASLLFRYTVQSGDLDSDGIAVASPIDLNGGTIKDTNGNDAVLSFTPPNTSGVLVDGVAPAVVQVTPPANGAYRAGQVLDVLVRFSEPVIVGTTPSAKPYVRLRIGSVIRNVPLHSQPNAVTLRFRYTVQTGDLDTDGIEILSPVIRPPGTFIRDANGNNAITTFTNPSTPNVKVDAVAPTIVLVTPPANGHYVTGQVLDILVKFSEPVNVGTTSTAKPFIRLRIGSVIRNAVFHSQPNSTTLRFRYVIQPSDHDTNGIEILSPIMRPAGTFIRDLAGNDAIVSFVPPSTSGVLVN